MSINKQYGLKCTLINLQIQTYVSHELHWLSVLIPDCILHNKISHVITVLE